MDARQKKIEADLLELFRQSVGMRFRLMSGVQDLVPLEDEVTGVDPAMNHVMGRKYGNFHVTLCELLT